MERRLCNEQRRILVSQLEVAASYWTRTRGLLGRKSLTDDQALWILRCNSVHTFFMKFAIDLIFLSEDMKVVRTVATVRPGRLVWPVWQAASVIELNAGFLSKNPLRVGEQLHVDSAIS